VEAYYLRVLRRKCCDIRSVKEIILIDKFALYNTVITKNTIAPYPFQHD